MTKEHEVTAKPFDLQAIADEPSRLPCAICSGRGFYGIPGQRCRFCDGEGLVAIAPRASPVEAPKAGGPKPPMRHIPGVRVELLARAGATTVAGGGEQPAPSADLPPLPPFAGYINRNRAQIKAWDADDMRAYAASAVSAALSATPPAAAAVEAVPAMSREMVRDVLTALECGSMWTEGAEAHPRMLRAVDEFRRWAIAQEAAAPAAPVEAQPRFQWTCGNGCGVCKVKRIEFEYERTETLEGELLESKTAPMLVSACCGASLSMWDNEREREIEVALAEFFPARAALPEAQPVARVGSPPMGESNG